ncbi:hypothetical protein AVDCRST_MAG92-1496 [uncultured Coleofasciculus sp.]|jgi:hypothetical protein|uniref:Uncharacterized protein n=1 Tax=uncultured Coleofasciculus sp. TaxID=1267456 RepID=A0A6J4I245_9CYAN|nr:hypothetical protein AVDCRST_MAG92-1496 [uncultured Coleofasciculus sp.]
MAGNSQGQSNLTIKQFVERILNIGQLSRLEHLQLVTTFLSDYKVTDEERNQINRVFDELQTGRLKLVG